MTKRVFRLLGPLIIGLVFLAAIWLLYHELKNYRLGDIGAKLWDITPLGMAVALGLTVVNYLILIGYDWLAVRYVGQKLPLRRISLVSFCGYACSYNFGATLAGTTIRARLYAAWGVPALKILQLLVILGLTFWFGLFSLAGVVFLIAPPQLSPTADVVAAANGTGAPAATGAEAASPTAPVVPPDDAQRAAKLKTTLNYIVKILTNMRLWGGVLLAIALAYMALSMTNIPSIQIFGHRVPVPPFRLTLYQFLITWADMLVAGAVLYGLLRHIPGIGSYPELLGIYLVVYVAVVLSHVPGGYGVFEGGMLFCLDAAAPVDIPKDAVMAGLLVFRIIYFWLPLVLAIVLLTVNEMVLRKHHAVPAAKPEDRVPVLPEA